jgi:hypothetical protein
MPQQLDAAGVHRLVDLQHLLWHGPQADRGVDEDREEADQAGDDELGQCPEAEGHDQGRCDRHERGDVEHDRDRHHRPAHDRELADQHRENERGDERDHEAEHSLAQGDQGVV